MSSNTSGGEGSDQVIILQPYRDLNEIRRTIPGSHVMRANCSHLAWITPQAELFLQENPAIKTYCYPCRPKVDRSFIVPGVKEAARQALGADNDGVKQFEEFTARHDIQDWPT